MYNKTKSWEQQWIPNIELNVCTDSLAKETRDFGQLCIIIILTDDYVVTRSRLLLHLFMKLLITDFDSPRIITSPIARLKTHHYKDKKIHPNETRSNIQSKNCREIQPLTTKHIL
ncbi:hypothetical protein TNIN_480391 [Trichonephila inaurata madagascariensis]|uniref:Uncharacterized protein n=1 Tax=Trichonephila inaurata madagascariensis TaxID=2747483 RepID=A0A8X6WT93_9ARAC|nr:hypothetical protein TNIN_480391 [Trichonephila inaurata madagascariensis]